MITSVGQKQFAQFSAPTNWTDNISNAQVITGCWK